MSVRCATANIEAVDLSDLDMLDGLRHGYCRACLPGGPRLVTAGERFLAVCGVNAYAFGPGIPASPTPAGACAECDELLNYPCPQPGHIA